MWLFTPICLAPEPSINDKDLLALSFDKNKEVA